MRPNGTPNGYVKNDRIVKGRYICSCQPNIIFKSADGVCPSCEAECMTAEAFKEKTKANYSPSIMKKKK